MGSYLVDVPGLVIKYVNMIPAAELLYIREKLLRFRPAMRNCKSIEEAGSQSPVEVSLPTNNTSNNYLFQLSDELILRILTSLDVKDLIRCECVCRKFRDIIVSYSIYKGQLDTRCRQKGINNYMILPAKLSGSMSGLQRSGYYKRRLYHYIYIKYSWEIINHRHI